MTEQSSIYTGYRLSKCQMLKQINEQIKIQQVINSQIISDQQIDSLQFNHLQIGTKSMKSNLANILIFITLISIAFAQKEIDTFNILFPRANQHHSGRPLELVTASGGCFEWGSSSPEVVDIKGLAKNQGNCYNRGLVELKHIGPYQGSIYITATNIQTHELSNIPVRISPIHKIEIIAKSRLMNRNQMQDLKIFAYDQEHNMFTSLEGLKFEWQLVDSSNILSKVSLKNSHLRLPLEQRKQIQKRGAESDILVVKGQNPGKSIIKVKCIEPGYEHLKHEITISVQQRFLINPSQPVYLIAASKYNFNLISPSRESISIPKPYYKASLTSRLFKVSDSLQVIAPQNEDQTVLKVEDTRTAPSFSSEVTIYSKLPTSMTLKVDEYVIVGEENKIEVELFWNKQLLKGQTNDYKIQTELIYDPTKQTIKGSSRTTATVKATYKALVAEKRVHVVLPLAVVLPSQKITLPVDETFQLKIIGGSGVYDYQIENDVASISPSGVISSKRQGEAKITVVDKRVPRNQLTLKLIISPLSSIIPLETNKELNINEFGPVFTMARGKNYEQYTKCTQQQIALDIARLSQLESSPKASFKNSLEILTNKMSKFPTVKQSIIKFALFPFGIEDFIWKFSTYIKAGDISAEDLQKQALELENYGICTVHWLKNSQQFRTEIVAFSKVNANVRAKFNLRVYDLLKNLIESTQKDDFLIFPGSQLIWRNQGGSQSWEGPVQILLNSVKQNVEWPTIKCPQHETVLQMKLQKFNRQSKFTLLPVNQSKTIYVHCKYPSKLKIKFQNQQTQSTVINGLRNKIIKGYLIPLDNKGDTFYNQSNLVYESEKTTGKMKINFNEFQFDPKNVISERITFWTERVRGEGKKNFKRVQASFDYVTKDMFILQPHPQNHHLISLYNPKKTYTFNLKKISENSQIICEGSISCLYLKISKQIRVNTTRLGAGLMKIIDRQIYQNPTLEISFDVVDADDIVLELDKHTLQVQKKLTAEVKLFYQGKLIPAWQYDSRNLLLVHEAGLKSTEIQSSDDSQKSLYQISAEKSGSYKVTVQQYYPRYLESSAVLLTVYPRLETNVANMEYVYTKEEILLMNGEITVAVDCTRKVHIFGGPANTIISHETKDEDLMGVKYVPESKEIDLTGLQEGKTKVFFTISSQTPTGKVKIALLSLTVTVKPIDHVNLYSLDEALINAQFRIIPHLMVDGRPLLASVCNFEYKWKTDNNKIRLQGIDTKRVFGVNATALKQGDAFVTLQVMKDNDPVFVTTKQITIHKSLQIQLPSVIGQHESLLQTSTNLLIPPNSGYQLEDQGFTASKISESNQNLLVIIQNNKLVTGKEKGLASIKLQKITDQSYNNYLNVIVTPIKALFIENSYSVVKVDVGQVSNVRFYVQDKYGRLFYNNLLNIEYDIISSNEEVFSVSLDATKNFIRIHPKKEGEAILMLRLKSGDGSLLKLNEIPHDIVKVEVGRVIEPQSPIYLAVGGEVEIQYFGKGNEKWEVVSGGESIQVDARTRTVKAVKSGESIVSIGGSQVTIRVFQVTMKQKTITEPIPGKATLISEYIATGKWKDEIIYFQSISNEFNHINNHLNLTCLPVNKRYFTTKKQIIKTQDYDKLRCETYMNYDFDPKQSVTFYNKTQIPIDIEIKVVNFDEKGNKQYLHVTKRPVESTFWIPKTHQLILLSSEKTSADVIIKTTNQLKAEIIGTQKIIAETQFSSSSQTQVIRLRVDPNEVNRNFEAKLKVIHPITLQSQQVVVKYIIDETARKEQQSQAVKSSQEQYQEAEKPQPKQSQSLFSGWHWTDFIILIMAINFILILLYQTCKNGNDKYKTL